MSTKYVNDYITGLNISDALNTIYTGATTSPVDCTALQAAITKNITGCKINVADTCTTGTIVINAVPATATAGLITALVTAFSADISKAISDSPNDYAEIMSMKDKSAADIISAFNASINKLLTAVITTSVIATTINNTQLKQGLAPNSAGISCGAQAYDFSSAGQKTAINNALASLATGALLADAQTVKMYERYLTPNAWAKFINTVGIGGAIGIGIGILIFLLIAFLIFIKILMSL